MRTILVSLPSGAGVVGLDDGSVLITNDASRGGSGTFFREFDPFAPVKSWVDEDRCVVGGLLPPGAVSVEVVDDQGNRVTATVSQGAYAAVLEQPNDGHELVVCFRDAAGDPVRRPWASDYPSVRVTDAEVPCPGCGAIDYDEYRPFEEWRGGRGRPDGTTVPNPVVSCRVCGHEEPEDTFVTVGSDPPETEDEATRSARIALAYAQQRQHRWRSTAVTLRQTRFPIYVADGWPAELSGSGSQGDQVTEITINHYDAPDPDPDAGDRPRLAITTKRDNPHSESALREARQTLEGWLRHDPEAARWPDASRAAVTLWLRARDRKFRAAVLGAVRSEQIISIDGAPITTLMLNAADKRWVAVCRHTDLTIVIAAHEIEAATLHLEPCADPITQLLGPEPPHA